MEWSWELALGDTVNMALVLGEGQIRSALSAPVFHAFKCFDCGEKIVKAGRYWGDSAYCTWWCSCGCPALDLQKIKPGNIVAWREEGSWTCTPRWGQSVALQEGIAVFFKGVVNNAPRSIPEAQTTLSEFFLKSRWVWLTTTLLATSAVILIYPHVRHMGKELSNFNTWFKTERW